MRLAHGACFNVRGGISVFQKIAALEAGAARVATAAAAAAETATAKGQSRRTGWTDTHPASAERFTALVEQVEAQHLDRSSRSLSRCWQVESDLHVAWKAAAATAALLSTLTLASTAGRSG